MIRFKSLNQSKDFLKILKKERINTKYFTIYFDKSTNNSENTFNKYLNISFVIKKKVGNSVTRNKIKRRLKAAVQKILNEKQTIDLNYTYIVIGKNNAYKDKFSSIFNEASNVFRTIKKIES